MSALTALIVFNTRFVGLAELNVAAICATAVARGPSNELIIVGNRKDLLPVACRISLAPEAALSSPMVDIANPEKKTTGAAGALAPVSVIISEPECEIATPAAVVDKPEIRFIVPLVPWTTF